MQDFVLCLGSMGKDIFLPTDCGVVQKASQGITTTKQWAFGYGAKMHIEDRFQAPGGCACNVSVGLKKLSVEAKACGLIGDDADGKWLVDSLASKGVDVQHIKQVNDGATDASMILVHTPSGERTIFVNRDVGENFIFEKHLLEGAPWIFIGSMYGDPIQQNMNTIHNVLTSTQTKLIYNPGYRNIQAQPRTVCDLIHHTSLLFVNKVEAQAIVGNLRTGYNESQMEDELFLLEALSQQAATDAKIVLTAGSRGAWVKSSKERLYIAVQDKNIIDTTGAGDAFASGFTAAHILKLSLADCMRWGGANSHNVIGYYGGHEGLLSKSDLENSTNDFEVIKC